MEFSARNQLKGTVKSVKTAGVMADVIVELSGGQQGVSAITRGSVESMNPLSFRAAFFYFSG